MWVLHCVAFAVVVCKCRPVNAEWYFWVVYARWVLSTRHLLTRSSVCVVCLQHSFLCEV